MRLGGLMFFYAVCAVHVVVVAYYIFRRRPPHAKEVKRAHNWTAGILIQTVAVVLVWAVPRATAPNSALGAFAVLLAVASAALMIASVEALGRQFAYEARLVEEHRLITTGPYRFMRNPIYTALYGLTVAVALTRSAWFTIPLFTVLYALGTALRVGAEERLLREHFGAEFEEWARRVPAVTPGLRL
ncbi:MAG TPA: isoprenylcysteine carboxylmethyltransferase family protein [Bryobacteraceae bacterium]